MYILVMKQLITMALIALGGFIFAKIFKVEESQQKFLSKLLLYFINPFMVVKSFNLVFDAAFYDSVFFAELQKTDSVEMFLALHVLKPFYQSKQFPADSLPLKEDVTLTISWKIEKGPSKSFVDSVSKIKPATWLSELNKWKPDSSADTTVTIAVSEKDSVLKIGLPSGLISAMKKLSRACRLQLRLSAPEASRAYRFYGVETASYPKLWASFPKDKSFIEFNPFRTAHIVSSKETCSDCAVLHGGIYLTNFGPNH